MKVYILKEEDMYSKSDTADFDCGCSNDWITVGAFSTRKKAEVKIEEYEKETKKNKFSFKRYYVIEELELDV